MLFRLDPCGIICLILIYSTICYIDYVLVKHVVMTTMADSLLGASNVFIFNVILFLLIFSHLRAVFSDPGMVPLPKTNIDFSDLHSGQKNNNKQQDNGWTICMKCETYRPPRAHHCKVCRRCIRRMDHHCPWINNCVGESNQKYFIQFLFYVGLACIYSISLVVASFLTHPSTNHPFDHHYRIVHSCIIIIISLLFGLFVVAIGCDQMQAILGDETAVEHAKKQGSYRGYVTKYILLAEVFGKGTFLCWLCPFQPKYSLNQDNYYDV